MCKDCGVSVLRVHTSLFITAALPTRGFSKVGGMSTNLRVIQNFARVMRFVTHRFFESLHLFFSYLSTSYTALTKKTTLLYIPYLITRKAELV